MEIVALAGGVGASKLLVGLAHAMAPENLTIVVNTGDDLEMHGLTICPDLDIVTYTLAGIVNPATGWGIDGDTFATLQFLGRYEREIWFNLGDRDLATHIHRSDMLRSGATLSECADSIRRALGVRAHILPMSDQPVRTQIETPAGLLPFQNYLVKHRAEPAVKAIRFDGADRSEPAPGVLRAIAEARGIVICPSNPLISIGPILAVPGIREALAARRADVVAVCPIVHGMSLKGPTAKMMAEMGFEVSARSIAGMYRDIASRLVIDESDASSRPEIEAAGMSVEITRTVMEAEE
ncbi:MAG TPA: 2-phospho-L-lactate transferase, partial [Candidatus Acidoferrales bacterium]|nr:2-phospho-L-lactate transferase [Candidatus Acidoferrales bacterium]